MSKIRRLFSILGLSVVVYVICIYDVIQLKQLTPTKGYSGITYDRHKEFQLNPKNKDNQANIYHSPPVGPSRWASIQGETLGVYVLSAFWDDRWTERVRPVISVLAALQSFQNGSRPSHVNCICRCSGTNETYIIWAKVNEKIHGWYENTYRGQKFGYYVIMCDVGFENVPDRLMLSYSNNIPLLTWNNSVPVEYPEKELKYEFGLCVPISFGDLDPYRLVEWLEFQKILGVSWVGVYDAGLSNATRELLRHYEKEKFVFINRNEAVLYPRHREELRIRCSLAITDCVYRHMYNTRYILVNDFDEAIVPTERYSLKEMMSEIEGRNRYKYIVQANFKNAFFLLDEWVPGYSTDPGKYKHSTFLKYRNRFGLSPAGWHTKSIIDPQGCVLMHNHLCHHSIHEYRKAAPAGHRYGVPVEIGRNLHYRHNVCEMINDRLKCQDKLLSNMTFRDNVMLKYEKQLVSKIKKALVNVNLTLRGHLQ